MTYLFKEYDEDGIAHGVAVTQPPDVYFDDPVEEPPDARAQAVNVMTRFLIWVAEGRDAKQRGVRATVALYCLRHDLIDGASLRKIAAMGDYSVTLVWLWAKDFRSTMGLAK